MVPLVKVCCMLSLLFNFSNGFAPRKVVRINPIDHMPMIDDLGRERYFHGMNVVYKQKPYVPIIDSFHAIKSFGYADIQIFKVKI